MNKDDLKNLLCGQFIKSICRLAAEGKKETENAREEGSQQTGTENPDRVTGAVTSHLGPQRVAECS
jgi:hypothetical protein